LRIVYTPLHGVGGPLARAALTEAGFHNLVMVREQEQPDPAFPTVAFPNPEEPATLTLALQTATNVGADLILANDPDADRLAVAVASANGFVVLSGNDVGVLLGHAMLTERSWPSPPFVVATVVSSPMLGKIARALGVRYEETLTGFKWIATRALEVEQQEGLSFAFGYEEALGYAVGTSVRDKDGIAAALLVADLAASCAARGETLLTRLDSIQHTYGVFASAQATVTGNAALVAMDRLRAAPPTHIAGYRVRAICDYATGTRLPASDVLAFELDCGRVTVRPSGTEAKLKIYADVLEEAPCKANGAVFRGRAQSNAEVLAATVAALVAG
jgi:phosphomannomutase